MTLALRISLECGETHCCFTLDDQLFVSRPVRGDEVLFDLPGFEEFVVLDVDRASHVINGRCYIVCVPKQLDSPKAVVELYEAFKACFGYKLMEVDGSKRPSV